MGVSNNTHASSTSATTTPEAISQIEKQRTYIPEQKNGMVETRKARRTDLRVWSHLKKTQSKLKKQRSVKTKTTIRPESFL